MKKITFKQKFFYVFSWIWIALLLELFFWFILIWLYQKWFFDDKWWSWDVNLLNISGLNISWLNSLNINFSITEDMNWKGIIFDNDNNWVFEISFPFTKYKKLKIDKNLVDFMIVKDYFTKTNTWLVDFTVSYMFLHNFEFDVKTFLRYLSSVDTQNVDINWLISNYKLGFEKFHWLIYSWTFNEISTYYNNLSSDYLKFINSYPKDKLSTCYYIYCEQTKEIYDYVKWWILYDTWLWIINSELEKKYWVDKRFLYSIIMVENMRMHTTFKWNFKQLLIWAGIPILPVMNQFSYGLYGFKIKVLTMMVNSFDDKNSIFYVWENEFLSYIRSKYYAKSTNWYNLVWDESKLIDFIVNDKKVQSEIVTLFLLQQIKAWKTLNIDLNRNPWILLTLYNLWTFKNPHKWPQIWWSIIRLWNKDYLFGELWQRFFYSLEMKNVAAKFK